MGNPQASDQRPVTSSFDLRILPGPSVRVQNPPDERVRSWYMGAFGQEVSTLAMSLDRSIGASPFDQSGAGHLPEPYTAKKCIQNGSLPIDWNPPGLHRDPKTPRSESFSRDQGALCSLEDEGPTGRMDVARKESARDPVCFSELELDVKTMEAAKAHHPCKRPQTVCLCEV